MKTSFPIAAACAAGIAALLLAWAAARMGATLDGQADTSIGAPLPPIAYRTEPGGSHTLAHARGTAMVVLYRPTCTHCLSELARMERNPAVFDGIDIVFLTAEAAGAAGDPPALSRLLRRPNVVRGFAAARDIRHWFGTLSTPMTFIYRDGRLAARFAGDTPIESMRPALQARAAGAVR